MHTSRSRPKQALYALIAVSLAGCAVPLSSGDNPEFAAWFSAPPVVGYAGDVIELTALVKNVQAKKTVLTPTGVEEISEGGTHEVCAVVDGTAMSCRDVPLVPGEVSAQTFALRGLSIGQRSVAVINASFQLDVRAMPRIGDWINGTAVSVRLTAAPGGAAGGWQAEILYPPGTGVELVRFDPAGPLVRPDGSGRQVVTWPAGGGDVMSAHVQAAAGVVDPGLFRWSTRS